MPILNVTYQGRSADLPGDLDATLTDDDIRRLAVEVLRSGGIPGLGALDLPGDAFDHFVVDRFDTPEGGPRVYLRPKVPFGT